MGLFLILIPFYFLRYNIRLVIFYIPKLSIIFTFYVPMQFEIVDKSNISISKWWSRVLPVVIFFVSIYRPVHTDIYI